MKSSDMYKAIYEAAKNADEIALSRALNHGVVDVVQKINKLIMAPVYQLAYEKDQTATTFLLERGASKDHAVNGYAHGGHTDQVDGLLKLGASKDRAVNGYAIGGHIAQVNVLIEQGASKDAAVRGYAIGGHIAQVNVLLKEGASKDHAVRGYALGRHTAQVNVLIEQGASKDAAVNGYAIGRHIDQVNALLKENASKDAAVRGYALGGHIDQVNSIDLFNKINDLQIYGETLKKHGHPRKGDNAIRLAADIRTEVTAFLNKTSNAETVSDSLSTKIDIGKKLMGENRKLKDILAHIVLALTGVGLMIILGKKFLTASKSAFLNSTKRQKILSDIDKEVHKVLNAQPRSSK